MKNLALLMVNGIIEYFSNMLFLIFNAFRTQVVWLIGGNISKFDPYFTELMKLHVLIEMEKNIIIGLYLFTFLP